MTSEITMARRGLRIKMSNIAPAYFFVDIQNDQLDGFLATSRAEPGVTAVDLLAGGGMRVHHAHGSQTALAIGKRSAAAGWDLLELTPERQSLEQVFVDLIYQDRGAQRAEGAP